MSSNVSYVQKQIKAFNKALSRADKSEKVVIGSDFSRAINDLIDYERMTKSGYAMAGTKFLEKMTPEELLTYSADIQQAKNMLEIATLSFNLDLEGATDPKSVMWKLYDKLIDKAMPFDSDYVFNVVEGNVNISYRDLAFQMHKYETDEHYTLADVHEWWDSKVQLED